MGEHGHTQLMQAGERQLHLGLDSGDLREPATGRLPGGVSQQLRLPHPRLAPDYEHGAAAIARIAEQLLEAFALFEPVPQSERVLVRHGRQG
jgi:hypothetical protein